MPTTTTRRMPAKLEDAEFLAQTGETLAGALPRLQFRSHKGLHQLCTRHGRMDIYHTLAARDLA